MILVRDVFQAKYGKGDDLVALLKEIMENGVGRATEERILTDASGPFFTIVYQRNYESLTEWDKPLEENVSNFDFAEWFARMMELVDSGQREFYNIEA